MVDVNGKILLKGAPEVTIVDESESTPGMSRQITGLLAVNENVNKI